MKKKFKMWINGREYIVEIEEITEVKGEKK